MPLRLFDSRNVSGANLVQALVVVGMFGMFFLGALYMQQILGYSALEVGLAFLPWTIVMGAMSFRFAALLNMRFGPQATLLPALVFIAAGMLYFARTPVDGAYAIDILPAMIVMGLGTGFAFPSLMMLAMSGATPSDSGLASGLVNTSVQVGGAVGLAVLATLATERTGELRADGEPAAAALNGGYHLAYLIGAGLVGVAFVVAIVAFFTQRPTKQEEGVRAEPVYSTGDHPGILPAWLPTPTGTCSRTSRTARSSSGCPTCSRRTSRATRSRRCSSASACSGSSRARGCRSATGTPRRRRST